MSEVGVEPRAGDPRAAGPVVQPAAGTTLGCDFTTPLTYLTIGNILNITGPSSEVGSVETTVLTSTRKTYRFTIVDPGELTFELDFDPTDTNTHTLLAGLQDAPAMHSWQITYPTTPAKKATVSGFLTKFEPNAGGVEENLTASVTVKLSGPIVWS
jgi:hypothetical protein